MFRLCSSGDYATATCARSSYLLYDAYAGVEIASESPGTGLTIAVVGGAAQAHRGAVKPAGASIAIQGYPVLVADGVAVGQNTGSNASRTWRAALCVFADGRVGFAVMIESMAGFARALVAAGVVSALYTDGGGSTDLILPDGSHTGSRERRRVAAWLIARR